MPQGVTHVLIALILASFIRDFYISKKDKKNFPLHYVLIAGIAGLLPDLDIITFWILNFFGFTLSEVHRTFTHTLFLPIILLIIGILTLNLKNHTLGRHHLNLHMIFFMLALGSFIHLILDTGIAGTIRPFYPLSNIAVGWDITSIMPYPLNNLFFPSLDAVLLVLWLLYVEWKHRISDFI